MDLLGGFTQREKDRVGSIVRVYGEVRIRGQAVNSQVGGRFGMHIVTDDAMSAGALPEALDDADSPWYWNNSFYWDEPTLELKQYPVETRTRRRLPSSKMTLAFIIENNAALSTQTLEYGFGLRLLFTWK